MDRVCRQKAAEEPVGESKMWGELWSEQTFHP